MAKKTLNDEAKGAKAGDGLALDAKQGITQSHTGGSETGSKGHKGGSSGLERILSPEKNDDEFAKGTVASPSELDEIRDGPNQDGMGEETLLYGGGYFEVEKAGLEDGVSVRETMDVDKTEPNYNYDIDPMTGNAPERKVGRSNNYTVSGKRRNKFLVGEM